MSNIDKHAKRALREAAERAKDNFIPCFRAPTRDVLDLLDELEAKDKRLNEILTPNMLLPVIDDMGADNLRHVIKTVCENHSLLHAKWEAAERRIANQCGIIQSARKFISEYAGLGDVGAAEFIKIIDRAAAKGE